MERLRDGGGKCAQAFGGKRHVMEVEGNGGMCVAQHIYTPQR